MLNLKENSNAIFGQNGRCILTSIYIVMNVYNLAQKKKCMMAC